MQAFIPFIFVFVIMYVALILPQQRQAKASRLLIASLAEGDEVMLNSGIHGFITSIDGAIVWLEVAEGVELKVSRAMVSQKIVDPGEQVDDVDDAAADDDSDGRGDSDTIDAD